MGFRLMNMHLNALFGPMQDLKSEALLGMRHKIVKNAIMLVNNYVSPKLVTISTA